MNRIHSTNAKAILQRIWSERKYQQGLCVLCGRQPHATARRCCTGCLEKNKAHNRRRRASLTVPEASTSVVGASI